MFWRNKELKDVVGQTKRVKVRDVLFTIRKLEPVHYLNGSRAAFKIYDTWKREKDVDFSEKELKKIKEHYKDVLIASIVKPLISRDGKGESTHVDEIINDWEFAGELYTEIMCFTKGVKKKKMQHLTGRG